MHNLSFFLIFFLKGSSKSLNQAKQDAIFWRQKLENSHFFLKQSLKRLKWKKGTSEVRPCFRNQEEEE
jgi:hypothetical protein